MICYPNDIISLTFKISATGGKGEYSYKWINPATLNGNGPFTIDLTENLNIKYELSDSENNKKLFNFQIKRDTIDSLKYDYRNSCEGLYDCTVNFHNGSNPTLNSIYQDTIKVTKSQKFNYLEISNIVDVSFYSKPLIFRVYQTRVEFKNDSIYINKSIIHAGLIWNYKGKRISN